MSLPSLLLVSFQDMLINIHSETKILVFLPFLLGIIAYHISSKNSTSSGLLIAGLVSAATGFLFYNLSTTITAEMTIVISVSALVSFIGIGTLYFANKQRK